MEKFLFDTSFDSAERARKEPELPPEPTFGPQDLDAARAAAWSEGKAAGEAEQQAAVAAMTQQAVAKADVQLASLSDQLVYVADQARRDALSCAMTALRTLFPRLAAEHGLREIETVVAQCLELARHEPAIVFKFHPDVQEDATPHLEAMAAARAFPGKLVILADQSLPRDGCAIEWADGGAERNSEAILEQIEEIIGQALDSATEPHPTAEPAIPASPTAIPTDTAPDAPAPETPEQET